MHNFTHFGLFACKNALVGYPAPHLRKRRGERVCDMDINRVMLTGNVLSDSTLSTTGNGIDVCDFRVCVNNQKRNPVTGKWESNLVMVSCFVYGNAASIAGKQIQKGRRISVEGRLYTSSSQQDGKYQYHTHVDVDTFDVYGR